MKKGTKITVKITYDMYLTMNKVYKNMNETRVKKGLKEFKNKSEFYNYFIKIYVDELTKAKSKEYEEYHNILVARKLKKVEAKGKKCKVIGFTLEHENAWYIKYYLAIFNEETISKNVYYLMVLLCKKYTSQRLNYN